MARTELSLPQPDPDDAELIKDITPPEQCMQDGGADIVYQAQPADQTTIARTSGSTYVEVFNAGSDRVWLAFGKAATVGRGTFLDPGGVFYKYTAQTINVAVANGDSTRVTWAEWGTP